MPQTREWLDGYIRAWRSKTADDVRAIFTDDGRAKKFVEWFMTPRANESDE